MTEHTELDRFVLWATDGRYDLEMALFLYLTWLEENESPERVAEAEELEKQLLGVVVKAWE